MPMPPDPSSSSIVASGLPRSFAGVAELSAANSGTAAASTTAATHPIANRCIASSSWCASDRRPVAGQAWRAPRRRRLFAPTWRAAMNADSGSCRAILVAEVGELQRQVEVLLLEQLDRALQLVAYLAGDAHLLALNLRLHLELGILD